MRDPSNNSHYWDIELLDLGADGYATLTADETVKYHATYEKAVAYVRGYRSVYGRRESDGGPLERMERERQFVGDKWEGEQ